ncbi:RICIN domain-containing protein [Streptomyces sp. B1I3]|uniref:RICIN domain-containing protein n=1 Tax=Streptomyces sp. B1I3 TaxID=3042264 RepID=UPI00277EB3E8|nr:RICIN domain-containing protein [Streptomyces sp. B1I3]MDQ0791544.1 hypothetical protein [Streptomyces sp. B1I3]
MRKTFALTAAIIGMIGAFAAAPSAVASDSSTSAPSPVVTVPPALPTPEAPLYNVPDGAASSVGYKNFVNYRSGTCLDDSNGNGLRMHGCSDASYNNGYQAWRAERVGSDWKFKNVATQQCLDGSSGAGVRTHECSDASYNNGYQKWRTYYAPGGIWVSWKNVATGDCMDYSSANGLRLHTCSTASWDNGYQAWNM